MLHRARVPLCWVGIVLGCAPYSVASDLEAVSDSDSDSEEVQAELAPEPSPTIARRRGLSKRRCEVARLAATPIDEDEGLEHGSMRVRRGDALVELPLQETSFESLVVGTIVQTDVVQVFSNPFDTPIEAVYTFPLPEDGAVDDYWIHIGERSIHGTMKRRDEARATYEAAKQQGRNAALLEQERPNLFTQSVANIEPGEVIEVQIHVVAPLEREHGRYQLVLPTAVGPRFVPGHEIGHRGGGVSPDTDRVPDGSKISPPVLPRGVDACAPLHVNVDIATGLGVDGLRSEHHPVSIREGEDVTTVALARDDELANRDFALSWAVPGDEARAALMVQRQGDRGYFTLTIEPPTAPAELIPRDLVFVVDTSGSMQGVPLDTAKRTVAHALHHMNPEDAFQIVRFSEDASGLAPEPLPNTPSHREHGLRYIDSLYGEGGTHMLAGIQAALRQRRAPGRLPIVLFLTDGYIGNEAEVFATIDRELAGARLFSLGVGQSVNRHLLDGMAKMGRGAVTYMGADEKPEAVVERFYERIARPALTDLSIDWGDLEVSDVTPAEIPDLFVGQPLTVFGRFDGPVRGRAVIRGRAGGRSIEIPVAIDLVKVERETPGLASVWARQRIEDLLRSADYVRAGAARQEQRRERATELALEHRVLTEYTAFVAVDEQRIANPDGTWRTVQVPIEMAEGVGYEAVFGSQGLGLVGTGRGGGGSGYGTIGLGSTGLVGSGSGSHLAGFASRGTRVPRVSLPNPVVGGSMDRDVVRRVVRSHVNEVRYCYNQALAVDPTRRGTVKIAFDIDPTGTVIAANIASSSLPAEDVTTAKCIAKRVVSWTFPAPMGGGTVRVKFTFELAPS